MTIFYQQTFVISMILIKIESIQKVMKNFVFNSMNLWWWFFVCWWIVQVVFALHFEVSIVQYSWPIIEIEMILFGKQSIQVSLLFILKQSICLQLIFFSYATKTKPWAEKKQRQKLMLDIFQVTLAMSSPISIAGWFCYHLWECVCDFFLAFAVTHLHG